MNNIKTLSSDELVFRTKDLAKQERKITTQVIRLLHEIELRKLHLEMGYRSIQEFAVKELDYSDSSAARRVNAMKVFREVPSITRSIESGRLNLSVVSQAQTFFRHEKCSTEKKAEILESLEGKSQREAEKLFVQLAPHYVPGEKIKQLTEELTQLQLVLNQELIEKLDRVRSLKSHALKSLSAADLLEWMADFVLSKIDLQKKNPRSTTAAVKQSVTTRAPSTADRRALLVRAEERCEYVCVKTGRRCSGRAFLQYDHKQAWAMGGSTELRNLQILCAAHNRYKAVQDFGELKCRS